MTASVSILTPRKPKRLVTPLDMTPEELNQPGSWKEETKTMTTPDWADEEAAHLEADFMYPPQLEIVAAALRAAFLRGMREAAEICDASTEHYSAMTTWSQVIRAAADKLEKGEA